MRRAPFDAPPVPNLSLGSDIDPWWYALLPVLAFGDRSRTASHANVVGASRGLRSRRDLVPAPACAFTAAREALYRAYRLVGCDVAGLRALRVPHRARGTAVGRAQRMDWAAACRGSAAGLVSAKDGRASRGCTYCDVRQRGVRARAGTS